ncbi:hypothetical protein B0A49_13289, partial [Cryomyces minteri]
RRFGPDVGSEGQADGGDGKACEAGGTTRKTIPPLLDRATPPTAIFTLVDTNTMEVTLFRAVRPPVAFLLCGHEGGMQRAVGVSYDWTTGTCYRETVLRMETPVLEKMDRVSRLRLGLKRPGVDVLAPRRD